jgi:hypothetical protein
MMDFRTRARAALASRVTLPGQADLFHVEQPPLASRVTLPGQAELFHVEQPPLAPPLPRELLVEMLGAVIVKVVRG